MAIPIHGTVELPLLAELAKLGGSGTPSQIWSALADYFGMSSLERCTILKRTLARTDHYGKAMFDKCGARS